MIVYSLVKQFIPFQNHRKIRDDGDFLIVSAKSLDISYFNEVTKDFYTQIDGKKTVHEIVEQLFLVYEVDYELLVSDIMMLLRDLQWKSLVILKENNSQCKVSD